MNLSKVALNGFVLLLIIIVAVAVLISPMFYNMYFHPLARLSSIVEMGEEFSVVKKRFESYYEERKDNGTIRLNLSSTATCGSRSFQGRIEKCLSIYDLGVLETVYVEVAFDANDEVVDKLYIGD